MIKDFDNWLIENISDNDKKLANEVKTFLNCKIQSIENKIYRFIIPNINDAFLIYDGIFFQVRLLNRKGTESETYYIASNLLRVENGKEFSMIFSVENTMRTPDELYYRIAIKKLGSLHHRTNLNDKTIKERNRDLRLAIINIGLKLDKNEKTFKDIQIAALQFDLSANEKEILHITDKFIYDNRGRIKSNKFGL